MSTSFPFNLNYFTPQLKSCSYLLHHGKPRRNSQLPSLISYCTTSPIDDNTFNRAIPGSSFISPPSPEFHVCLFVFWKKNIFKKNS